MFLSAPPNLFRNKSSLPFAESFDLRHSANGNLRIYFVTVPYLSAQKDGKCVRQISHIDYFPKTKYYPKRRQNLFYKGRQMMQLISMEEGRVNFEDFEKWEQIDFGSS